MPNDDLEDWEKFPDDWYDGADEMLLRAYKVLLENCFSKPSTKKDAN
jgi:hypothetical protein